MGTSLATSGDRSTNQSFSKAERLCSKKITELLFEKGSSLMVFPLKVIYLETPLNANVAAQVAFSAGKRNFKKAVQRNLVKRRMREAYRLNKNRFYGLLQKHQMAVFFICVAKVIPEFKEIEDAMKKGMERVAKKVSEKTTNGDKT